MKLIAEWIAPALLAAFAWRGDAVAQAVNLADSVNTNVGGIGILLTSTMPIVQYPHGMMRVAPVTTPGISDVYLADKIHGFTLGPARLMASTANPAADAAHFAQSFDHDFEVARPYYYAVHLDESRVQAEMTATRRAAIYRFTFPVGTRERVMLSLSGHAALQVMAPDKVVGSQRVFVEQPGVPKYEFLSQFPDATGLEGMYAQGNEPSFHIPYLYDFSGQPWKTQKRMRELMDVWYDDGPMGIPGDDDGGETSSWYVFSAMGFYPVCPGSPVYEIGSPLFAHTRIDVGGGKQFSIEARGVSAQNKYIQSAILNGKPLSRPWFQHKDLVGGGSLVLTMGPEPNRAWGSSPADAPPSMSSQAGQ